MNGKINDKEKPKCNHPKTGSSFENFLLLAAGKDEPMEKSYKTIRSEGRFKTFLNSIRHSLVE